MLKTRVIPCMLFNGFNLIKTIKFENIRNLGNPIQTARVYNSRNVDELIFIDMKASEDKREIFYDIVENIAKECFMPLTIGGGIHSLEDISRLLKVGADKVSINSEAIKNSQFIRQASKKFGSQCVVVSIDVKKEDGDYYVFINRGKENSGKRAVDWAKEVERFGAGEILLNSIDKDGTMGGFDCDLVKEISSSVSLPIIALGGAGKVQDIIDVIKLGGADAVSLSSMFHYSGHTVNSIKQRMLQAEILVRII